MNRDEEIDPMGWQLGHSVVKGEIDARKRGQVTGYIWLLDRHFPIELSLKGNPLKDLAGCLLTFDNPNPQPEENEGLSPIQMGRTGEISASRKTRVYDLSPQQVYELRLRGEPVNCQIGNLLTIEWFSNANGRVTIEATDFNINISEFSWRLSNEEEQEQIRRNKEVFERWSTVVAYESDHDDEIDIPDGMEDANGWQMDEFQWEKQLQESDAMTRRYMELIELYLDHPEREQIIAHEMGWNGLDAILDDDDEVLDNDFFERDEDEGDEFIPLEPLAHTEGRDWIRSRDGSIRHPLCERAVNLAMNMWDRCKALGLTDRDGDGDADIQAMLFNVQTISAKLAGALNALAYDDDPDGGFIVACLKRSLNLFGQTITSMSIVSQKNLLPPAIMQGFREEIFGIRQDVLSLMNVYRQLR